MSVWVIAITGIFIVWIPLLTGSVVATQRTVAANVLASAGFVVMTLFLIRLRRRSGK